MSLRYLSQSDAIKIDQILFNRFKFSLDQLMELAGLSCAQAFYQSFPIEKSQTKVLVACGPGNNGGDGLVCARHLQFLGYNPTVYYPKPSKNEFMKNLVTQLSGHEIKIIDSIPAADELKTGFTAIVDALFGFSFQPPVREPFGDAIKNMVESGLPIFSVDIPSGWDVETGPADPQDGSDPCVMPTSLISLTAPKLCARKFEGLHWLGGRFVPKQLADEFDLKLPDYPDTDAVVLIS